MVSKKSKTKTLVVYYSRTGTTKKVAELVKKKLSCDLEEIDDLEDRQGARGYLKSGKDAMMRKESSIAKPKRDCKKYDLVIVGTPVWAFNMSAPTRTYLNQNWEDLKKVAFFCTMDGSGSSRTFKEMEKISKKPIAKESFLTKEVHKGDVSKKIDSFLKRLE